MAVFVRAKRVTDPLNDRVRACLCGEDYQKTGYGTSGSEHEAEDSAFLSDLIHGFLEDDAGKQLPENREDSDGDESDFDPTATLKSLLTPTVDDRFQSNLFSHVSKAADAFSGLRSDRAAFRRSVMASLRDSGYNAGICKTKWETIGGLTGGNYEFIDVVRSGSGKWQRYLIDLDFEAEFEVARPTEQYARLLQGLPRIYIGRPEEMKQIVRIIADAAKKSLKSRDLHLPPWRKNRYMQAKWLGPYRRTLTAAAFSPECERFSVKCRSVGFDAGGSSRFLFPPATRTR
ncbi:hypothetical protein AAC387_Pa02g4436 [Persea americana]